MPRKCRITGKFMSKESCIKCDIIMAIRSQTVMVIGMLIIVATAILTTTKSDAAEFKVEKYSNSDSYYINMTGEITKGDAEKLKNAYFNNKIGYQPTLIMDSPGGEEKAMLAVIEIVKKYHMKTRVHNDGHCMSACAVIWTHGKEVLYKEGNVIGFHVSSFIPSPELSGFVDNYGLMGFQKEIQRNFKDSLLLYSKLPINNPTELIKGIITNGWSSENFFYIDNAYKATSIIGARVF